MHFDLKTFFQKTPLLFLAALALLFPLSTWADDVRITANLSAPTTTVDEPVRLTVTISGARNANLPSRVEAEGLDVDFRGKSQRFEMSSGFGISASTVVTYLVTPQKPGTFTIPAITIEAGGKSYSTNPLSLTVEKGAADPGNATAADSKEPQIFAELIVPQDTAYVGEVIPIEVRFYFDSTITAQLNPPGQVPQIDGEGFSKLRYPQPRLEHKNIKNKEYTVLAYQTGLVAAKSGDLTIGPASLNFVVAIPQPRRQRNPLNDPFSDDIFNNNPFFNNQRIEREMTVNAEPVKLHIKALPTPRPPGFAGAVGQFTLQNSAKPTKVNVGDPITLTSVIAGRGNFDLVTAPTLTDTDGWRTYPPTGNLKSSDDMGVAGEKTFQTALLPEKKNSQIPEMTFVYFDPAQSKYITLKSAPIPVQIEGNAMAVVPTATPTTADATKPGVSPAAVANNDLPPLKTALVGAPSSFAPIWENRAFWVFQAIPLLLLGALAWPKIAAALASDATKLRLQTLHRERDRLASSLRSNDPQTFFPAMAHRLEIEAALAVFPRNAPASEAEIGTALHFTDLETEIAHEVFSRRDELTYGGGRGGKELTTEARRRYEGLLLSQKDAK